MTPGAVRHDEEKQRFEIELDGGAMAIAEYRKDGGTIVFTHTEVPHAFEGHGIAGQLAKAGLEWAKGLGLPIVPRCKFIAAYVKKHPEYQSMVAPAASP
ncbi:MAG TPA: GNAT family N-acetyltransferase [Polyangiaceae bacterium]|jgi:predicted GNAT family acetyltransferase|nr:GNAT family N-acetyltransferase [Polyangiaceae bacterium]